MTAKRGPIALAGVAAAGFAGTLGFHLSGTAAPLRPPARAPHAGPAPASGPATATGPAPSGGATSTAPVPAATGTRSATGPVENYGYGQLAVRVTVTGTKITGLSVIGLQTAESYSQQLAAQVIPMLRTEVLSAQSAQVNAVSGATYTTEAYTYSIQSALDALHVK